MEDVATVVLGLEEPEVAEEVMHFLDRSGGARVVATAQDPQQLAEAIRQLEPDAVIASSEVAHDASLQGSVLLALETAESVRALRAAIRFGARGFFVWPGDRDALAGAAARLVRSKEAPIGRDGRVWTVFGPRGGAGTTFVACHLAATLVGAHPDVVLVDLDLGFADLSHALGVGGAETRTLADLVPVLGELVDRHLNDALWSHPAGFRALLAPAAPDVAAALDPSSVAAMLGHLRSFADRVVVHVPRGLDPTTRAALTSASRVAMVIHPDVLSLRGARRAIEETGVGERTVAVVTATVRGELGLGDIERGLGCPAVVIPADPSAAPAQDRGELVPLRGRTGRAFLRLAEALEGRR